MKERLWLILSLTFFAINSGSSSLKSRPRSIISAKALQPADTDFEETSAHLRASHDCRTTSRSRGKAKSLLRIECSTFSSILAGGVLTDDQTWIKDLCSHPTIEGLEALLGGTFTGASSESIRGAIWRKIEPVYDLVEEFTEIIMGVPFEYRPQDKLHCLLQLQKERAKKFVAARLPFRCSKLLIDFARAIGNKLEKSSDAISISAIANLSRRSIKVITKRIFGVLDACEITAWGLFINRSEQGSIRDISELTTDHSEADTLFDRISEIDDSRSEVSLEVGDFEESIEDSESQSESLTDEDDIPEAIPGQMTEIGYSNWEVPEDLSQAIKVELNAEISNLSDYLEFFDLIHEEAAVAESSGFWKKHLTADSVESFKIAFDDFFEILRKERVLREAIKLICRDHFFNLHLQTPPIWDEDGNRLAYPASLISPSICDMSDFSLMQLRSMLPAADFEILEESLGMLKQPPFDDEKVQEAVESARDILLIFAMRPWRWLYLRDSIHIDQKTDCMICLSELNNNKRLIQPPCDLALLKCLNPQAVSQHVLSVDVRGSFPMIINEKPWTRSP